MFTARPKSIRIVYDTVQTSIYVPCNVIEFLYKECKTAHKNSVLIKNSCKYV